MTTAVALSRPPAANAAHTRRSAIIRGGSCIDVMAWISASAEFVRDAVRAKHQPVAVMQRHITYLQIKVRVKTERTGEHAP